MTASLEPDLFDLHVRRAGSLLDRAINTRMRGYVDSAVATATYARQFARTDDDHTEVARLVGEANQVAVRIAKFPVSFTPDTMVMEKAEGIVLVLHDMIDQPDFNWATQHNRGEWSLRDVSAGAVFAGDDGKPRCVDHGAMNCVTSAKSIWRCLMCGRAAYVTMP